jgi:hypothetical protein
MVILNCSEASERYPIKLLSDSGQSLYDLASLIEPQTGGWREDPAEEDEEFGLPPFSHPACKPQPFQTPVQTPFLPASLANFTG